MSALIVRIELTSMGETVNQQPASGLGPSNCDCDTVLEFDAQFQDQLRDLPGFFQLDPVSIQHSQAICEE